MTAKVLNFAAFAAETYWLERAIRAQGDGALREARTCERQANYWHVRIGKPPARSLRIRTVYPDFPPSPIRFVEAEPPLEGAGEGSGVPQDAWEGS